MVTVAAVLLLLGAPAGPVHAARGFRPAPWGDLFGDPPKPRGSVRRAVVPLPKPRPADAPAAETGTGPAAEPQPPQAGKPAEQAAPASPPAPPPAPQASACRQALTEAIAIAPSILDIHGAGGCGGEDLVRLEAIVLPDARRVSVKPAAILRCAMASELADWIRKDIAPLAVSLGSTISDLDNFDSFECRGRNRIVGARLSEHGRANALDVRALKLANGRSIALTDRTVPREVRETVLHSVCARFTTVLGPGSDWYHEDHIHLDLMERRNNYRICQWDVLDPLPQVAPLLPAVRPDDAPPREVAAKSDGAKSDGVKSDGAKSDGATPEAAAPAEAEKSDEAEPEPAAKPATKKPATKKRR
ncbi:Uncharacterized conserved protein [Afipia sp. GAS231]|nr:Uncharacterized conserved protein [Afipia sp. GAS231]